MAQGTVVEGNSRTFVAGEAIAAHLRVKFNTSGQVVKAGATDACIGISTMEVAAALDLISVRLINSSGTFKAITAGAVAIGVEIYPAAAGCIDDASSGTSLGMSLEAASAAGVELEFARTA